MQRYEFLSSTMAALALSASPAPSIAADRSRHQLAGVEASTGGRLGVVAIDTGSERRIFYRGDERFLMCSTFKVLAVAAVLSRVDRGEENLDRRIPYTNADLLEYAPVTRKNVNKGFMELGALCEAAILYSDNTAANLLLQNLGGPKAVTQYARSIGDSMTTLNRTEPALNRPVPGNVSDTTTPSAMAKDMQKVLLGRVLSVASRGQLEAWLVESKTGANLLRAGVPASWRVGDKTGLGGAHNHTGDSDTRNDLAIMWPPKRAPILVAAYLTQSQVSAVRRDAALASVGRIVSAEFV